MHTMNLSIGPIRFDLIWSMSNSNKNLSKSDDRFIIVVSCIDNEKRRNMIMNSNIKLKLIENLLEVVILSINSYFLKYFDFFIPAIELTYDPISSICTIF